MMCRFQARLPFYAFVVFALLMGSAPAHAHLNTTGMGPVYDGLMHFLMSPEDLIPVLGLALLAGLRGPEFGRWAMFVAPGAWLIGGLTGTFSPARVPNAFVSAAWFLLLGGLVAADAKLSLRATIGLAALLGLFHGYFNGTGMVNFSVAGVALPGLVFGVFVLVTFAAAFVVRLKQEWMRIAVRVGGSWIAACGLLLLGWASHR